jgi:zinc/manganese transport system permease protein
MDSHIINLIHVFGIPFLLCLAMITVLGYLGIHVLKREVIFIDIALAQIAAVGSIGAHLAFGAHGHSVLGYSCAFGATLLAAAFYALVRRSVVQIPLEAVIGVSYAIAAAGALFLLGIAPGGHVHIQQMLAGSILWATWTDVVTSGVVFGLVGLCLFVFRKPFEQISESYGSSPRDQQRMIRWDFFFYALLGLVITLAVRIAGVVLVFAFLIIPATLSALFAPGWRERLVVTWITGGLAALLGLLFAERFDFSVGPSIALFLGAALVLVGLLRLCRVEKTIAAAVSLSSALGVFLWFLLLSGSPGSS